MYAHAQAPVRISIAGGGTDLPAWTRERRGLCLSLAIRMHTHAFAIARPDGKVVASYSKLDTANAATEIANGLVRESSLMHGWETGFEVHTASELSSLGSGLGVSSSIAVALAACFQRLQWIREGGSADPKWRDGGMAAHRMAVARDAWTVEIDRLRRPIGRQDHMAAAHGGLRIYSFQDREAAVERIFDEAHARWLAEHLLLVRLPEGHDSRAILAGVHDLAALSETLALMPSAIAAVERRDLAQLGVTLSQGHAAKRKHCGVSPPWLEKILEQLASVSAVAGFKVAGAGGGGHVIVACESGSAPAVSAATNLPTLTVAPDFDGVRSDGWM